MAIEVTEGFLATWEKLKEQNESQRPSVGKRVKVVAGKKYLGKVGTVTWHGRDRFHSTRYETEAQAWLHDLIGRTGFRVRIDTGSETFFVGADRVEVINA